MSCTQPKPHRVELHTEILAQRVAVNVEYRQSLPKSCSCNKKIALKLPLQCLHFITIFPCNCYITLNLLVYHLASLPSSITFSPCLESVPQGIVLGPRQDALFLVGLDKSDSRRSSLQTLWLCITTSHPHSAFLIPFSSSVHLYLSSPYSCALPLTSYLVESSRCASISPPLLPLTPSTFRHFFLYFNQQRSSVWAWPVSGNMAARHKGGEGPSITTEEEKRETHVWQLPWHPWQTSFLCKS